MTSISILIGTAVVCSTLVSLVSCEENQPLPAKCGSSGQKLKYIWGDALTDDPNCIGPNDQPYPSAHIARNFKKNNPWGFSSRMGRASYTIDPYTTRRALLRSFEITNLQSNDTRTGREMRDSCGASPTRVCQTRYNTTAPLYGISLTSGQPVTIVQKFPDLLQQVIYEVCETKECEVIRGECSQTYVPYLFLVIPLGPVTLTGQDYVLVESGCVCKPRKSVSQITATRTSPFPTP